MPDQWMMPKKILKSRAIFTDFGGTSPLPVHNLLRPGIFK
jgi:hypothetical protein